MRWWVIEILKNFMQVIWNAVVWPRVGSLSYSSDIIKMEKFFYIHEIDFIKLILENNVRMSQH